MRIKNDSISPSSGHEVRAHLSRRIFLLVSALPLILSSCRPAIEAGSTTPTRSPLTIATTVTEAVSPSDVPPISPTHTETPTLTQPILVIGLNVDNVPNLQYIDSLASDQGSITDLAFSPDSQHLASSSSDGTIHIWDIQDSVITTTLEGHSKAVHSLDFSPDGSTLASGSDDGSVRIWDAFSGELLSTIDSPLLGRILKVAYSPDGLLLGMADHQCLAELRRTSSGILHRTFPQSNCNVRSSGSVAHWGLEFASAGQQILLGEGRPCCGAGSILLWDVYQLNPPSLVKGFGYVVRDFDLSPSEESVAVALVGSSDIQILDLSDGTELGLFQAHTLRVNSLQFTPDGSLLVSGSRDTTAILWDVSHGIPLRTLEGHSEAINVIRISPDGRWLATGSDDQTIRIWGFSD